MRAPRRHAVIVLGLVAAAIFLIGSGWLLATLFQSPAQQEANAKAPAAAPVFSPVVEGRLAQETNYTGQVGPSSQVEIALLTTADATLSVVTGHPVEAGSILSSGRLLTEVNGRPVFLAEASFPFYRDMGFGDEGPDVTALQMVLASLGYDVAVDSRFGTRTVRAVVRWYADNGFTAPARPRPTITPPPVATTPSSDSGQPAPPPVAPVTDAYVPVSEIVSVPFASAEVLRGVGLGTRVASGNAADLVLGAQDTLVTVSVPPGELGTVAEGDVASISFNGDVVQGIVGAITIPSAPAIETPDAETLADGGAIDSSANVSFIVTPTAPLPASPRSGQARITVVKDVLPEDTLIVPVLAITDRGSQDAVVMKRRPDGTLREVAVSILATSLGQVAIASIGPGELNPGDEVRVG